jgi:Ca2+-binding EF-hand superfamily protein
MSSQDDAKKAFDEIDADGDGFITASELKAALTTDARPVTEENMAVIVRMADDDGDQKITLEEFSSFVR